MPNAAVLATALAGLIAATGPVSAQSMPTHRCAAIDDTADRLACYDASFVRPGNDAERSVDDRLDEFGLSEADLRERDPRRKADDGPTQVQAVVARIDGGQRSKVALTLQNGQVWTAERLAVDGRLAAGDAVVIRKAALNSHMLVTPKGLAIRVRRAR